MATGKFMLHQTEAGFRFNLVASNGEIILTSEIYKTEKACRSGIASVQKNAPFAAVEDQTKEGFVKEKCPKFEVFTDAAGELRFRLKAKNGLIIGASEGYKSFDSCCNGIRSVIVNALEASAEKSSE